MGPIAKWFIPPVRYRRALSYLAIVIAWQAILTAIGAMVYQSAHVPSGNISSNLLSHTMLWDGTWYTHILQGGYSDLSSAAPVFYPLFPALLLALHTLSMGLIPYPVIGMAVNTLCVAASLIALERIATHFTKRRSLGKWFALLFLASPAAMFMHCFYTEALFCAIGFWAYERALGRRWLSMALLLSLLSACRLPAVLFILLCLLEYLRAYRWNMRQLINRRLALWLIVPLGFIGYSVFLWVVRDDPLAMFHAYKHSGSWPYQVFNPNIIGTYLQGWVDLFIMASTRPTLIASGVFANLIFPLLGLIMLVWSGWYVWRHSKQQLGLPLFVMAITAFCLFTVNSNVVSVHRYLLPCLSIYLALVLFYSKYRWGRVALYGTVIVSFALQIYLLMIFARDAFAG